MPGINECDTFNVNQPGSLSLIWARLPKFNHTWNQLQLWFNLQLNFNWSPLAPTRLFRSDTNVEQLSYILFLAQFSFSFYRGLNFRHCHNLCVASLLYSQAEEFFAFANSKQNWYISTWFFCTFKCTPSEFTSQNIRGT